MVCSAPGYEQESGLGLFAGYGLLGVLACAWCGIGVATVVAAAAVESCCTPMRGADLCMSRFSPLSPPRPACHPPPATRRPLLPHPRAPQSNMSQRMSIGSVR